MKAMPAPARNMMVVAVALLVVAAAATTRTAPSAVLAQGGGQTMTLTARDIAFDKKELTVSAGDTIELRNIGVEEHNFAIDGYNMPPVNIPPGGDAVVWTVPDTLAPGTYQFYCAVPGHRAAGMHGTLTVIVAGGHASASGTPETSTSMPASSSPAAGEDRIAALQATVAAQATQIADLESRVDALEHGRVATPLASVSPSR